MDDVAQNRRKEMSPYVSNRFSLGVVNKRAGAGRDGQPCLARPNSQARTVTGELADHEQDFCNSPG